MATDVSAPFPQLDLAPGTRITVTLDDAAANITQLNVYGYTPEKVPAASSVSVYPLFAYGPGQ